MIIFEKTQNTNIENVSQCRDLEESDHQNLSLGSYHLSVNHFRKSLSLQNTIAYEKGRVTCSLVLS